MIPQILAMALATLQGGQAAPAKIIQVIRVQHCTRIVSSPRSGILYAEEVVEGRRVLTAYRIDGAKVLATRLEKDEHLAGTDSDGSPVLEIPGHVRSIAVPGLPVQLDLFQGMVMPHPFREVGIMDGVSIAQLGFYSLLVCLNEQAQHLAGTMSDLMSQIDKRKTLQISESLVMTASASPTRKTLLLDRIEYCDLSMGCSWIDIADEGASISEIRPRFPAGVAAFGIWTLISDQTALAVASPVRENSRLEAVGKAFKPRWERFTVFSLSLENGLVQAISTIRMEYEGAEYGKSTGQMFYSRLATLDSKGHVAALVAPSQIAILDESAFAWAGGAGSDRCQVTYQLS